MNETEGSPYRRILIVFGALLILTIAEYFVAVSLGSTVLLLLLALAKAALIVQFFMHVYRLWTTEEKH